jgi:hypothetical protein
LFTNLISEEADRSSQLGLNQLDRFGDPLPIFQAQNSGHFINITSVADRWVGLTIMRIADRDICRYISLANYYKERNFLGGFIYLLVVS